MAEPLDTLRALYTNIYNPRSACPDVSVGRIFDLIRELAAPHLGVSKEKDPLAYDILTEAWLHPRSAQELTGIILFDRYEDESLDVDVVRTAIETLQAEGRLRLEGDKLHFVPRETTG